MTLMQHKRSQETGIRRQERNQSLPSHCSPGYCLLTPDSFFSRHLNTRRLIEKAGGAGRWGGDDDARRLIRGRLTARFPLQDFVAFAVLEARLTVFQAAK